jgi:hypothetical protein
VVGIGVFVLIMLNNVPQMIRAILISLSLFHFSFFVFHFSRLQLIWDVLISPL